MRGWMKGCCKDPGESARDNGAYIWLAGRRMSRWREGEGVRREKERERELLKNVMPGASPYRPADIQTYTIVLYLSPLPVKNTHIPTNIQMKIHLNVTWWNYYCPFRLFMAINSDAVCEGRVKIEWWQMGERRGGGKCVGRKRERRERERERRGKEWESKDWKEKKRNRSGIGKYSLQEKKMERKGETR